MIKVGEHITIDFLGVKKDYHEKYYVIDGKVVTWHQWRMNIRPQEEE